MSSRSTVDRAPARYSEDHDHGFDFSRGLRLFLHPMLCYADQYTFHISLPNLKVTIFSHLSLNSVLCLLAFTMTLES